MSSRAVRIAALLLVALAIAIGVYWWPRGEEMPVPTAGPKARPAEQPLTITTPTPAPTPELTPEPRLEKADVATRKQYYNSLVALPPAMLLAKFLAAANTDDTTKAILLQALTISLEDKGQDPSLTRQFIDALLNPSFSINTKSSLAQALAESATLPGITALLQVAENPTAALELRKVLHEAIAIVGSQRKADGRFPVDLSPPLEAAFLRATLNPQANPELAAATSLAVAQIGTETGARVLLQQIAGYPPAADALARIRNPAAISVLLEPVRTGANNIADPRLEATGRALVHIGGEAAVRPLLDWVKAAPADAQQLTSTWFANIREPVSYELVGEYLRSQSFRSSEVKAVLQQRFEANTPEDAL